MLLVSLILKKIYIYHPTNIHPISKLIQLKFCIKAYSINSELEKESRIKNLVSCILTSTEPVGAY